MKLIFLDVDGTLVNPGKQVSDVTKHAIAAAREKGNKVFLCTGRTEAFLPDELKLHAFDGGIFAAGARVMLGERLLSERPMPEPLRDRIEAELNALGIYYNYETNQGAFACNRPMIRLTEEELAKASSEVLRVIEMLQSYPKKSLSEYRGEAVYKISFWAESPEQAAELRRRLPEAKVVTFENFGLDLPCFGGEVSDPDVNKATAMRLLCAHLGCTEADCIAFGDSMNDAEIMEAAGLGIAMGNAEPQLKALADLICGDCDDDGVAKELERLGLI